MNQPMQSPFADQELIIESRPADKNDSTSPLAPAGAAPTPLKLPPPPPDKIFATQIHKIVNQ